MPAWECALAEVRAASRARDLGGLRFIGRFPDANVLTSTKQRRLGVTLRVQRWLSCGLMVTAALWSSACTDDEAEPLPPDVGVVEWVIDGDTVDVDIAGREERVRLIGINTPELHTDTGAAECLAAEALSFTAGQLPAGTEVRLERDVVGRDDYGRLLAYVFRRRDDVLINELIVAEGYARPLTIAPNAAYRDRFVAAARSAEAADVGLWATCAG